MQGFPFLPPEQSVRFVELVVQSVQISYAYQMGFLVLAMGIIPGAALEVFDKLGHRGVLRDARVVARVVRFLQAD